MNNAERAAPPKLPRTVWVLGGVSLLMDLSSEMIHAVLPLFLVTSLGLSALHVGIIEGIAEATAAAVKVFSGVISDRFGRRKPLLLLGYGLAALAKPLFALAQGLGLIVAARFVDRVGKGIRGAPRDALIADVTPPAQRGAAYGLRQSLDTVGAFAAPLVAMLLLWLSVNDFRLVFWIAVIPAVLAFALIVFGVSEPRVAQPAARRWPIRGSELKRLPAGYWRVAAIGAVFTLARFSEAFLLLRAENLGLALALAPLVLVVMSAVYAVSAYPFGKLADRIEHRKLLAIGIAFLIAADLVLAFADGWRLALLGAAIWGLHMGATQGLLSAMVAERAPADLRATGFGLFHLISGAALLLASLSAGVLWTVIGPAATFLAGAGFAAVAALALMPAPSETRGTG